MKKLVILGVALVIAIGASMALAAAVKLNLTPYDYGTGPDEPNASGQAILNYAKGMDKTEIQVNCWGLKPDTEYWIWIVDANGWVNTGTFTTGKNGTLNFHCKVAGECTAVGINSPMYRTVLYGK